MKSLVIHNIQHIVIRTGLFLFALFLFYLVYFFYASSVQIFGYQIGNPFYAYVEHLEWWLYLLVYFIIISILNTIAFLVLSLYFNVRNDKIQRIKRNYEFVFTEKIIGYLYSDFLKNADSTEEYYDYFEKSAKSKLSHETLFTVITRTQEMITEDLSVQFTALVENLGLKERLIYFLYSRNLSENIIALKIISFLKMKGYEEVIFKYSKSRNYVLRTEAIAALIRLSTTSHLDLLLFQQHLISKLDINVFINVAEKTLKEDINYINLIKSPSPRVATMGLMLIKIRNKIEYKELIKPILESKDELLREVAWEVFASMAGTKDDFELMTVKFENESFKNKLSIMVALRRFEQDENFFDFLDNVIKNHTILLKVQAIKILFENNMDRLFSYKESSDENIAVAYNEVVDLNII